MKERQKQANTCYNKDVQAFVTGNYMPKPQNNSDEVIV